MNDGNLTVGFQSAWCPVPSVRYGAGHLLTAVSLA